MIGIIGGLAAVVAMVGLNAVFVAAEFSLVTIRRTRVQRLVDDGRSGARSVADGVRSLDSYIAACQLGITVSSLALGWMAEPAVARLLDPAFGHIGGHAVSVAFAFTIITALHMIAGELAPKSIALQFPEQTALLVTPPLRLFRAACRPVIWLLNEAGWAAARLVGVRRQDMHSARIDRDELRLVVESSAAAGLLDEDQSLMLRRILHLSQITAEQVMTPRVFIEGVPSGAPVSTVLELSATTGHSRFPVYRGDLDHTLGVVYVRDAVRHDAATPVDEVARPLLPLPEQAPIQQVLRDMRRRRIQVAMVFDEHGQAAGLLTLDDILEEIVGELEDEFEEAEATSEHLPGGGVRINGSAPISVIEDTLGIVRGCGDAATVAGFFTEAFGAIPEVGAEVVLDQHRLVVSGMDGMRITSVDAWPHVAPATGTAEGEAATEARNAP